MAVGEWWWGSDIDHERIIMKSSSRDGDGKELIEIEVIVDKRDTIRVLECNLVIHWTSLRLQLIRAFCMHLFTFSMLIESGNPYVVVDHPAFYDCSTSSKWKLMRPECAIAPFFFINPFGSGIGCPHFYFRISSLAIERSVNPCLEIPQRSYIVLIHTTSHRSGPFVYWCTNALRE